MTTIVLVHGWGFDVTIWDALRAKLDPLLAVTTLDLGFLGAVPPAPTFVEPVIAVGHSLGALWWLMQEDIAWSKLLCVNGFPRFTETADYAPAVSHRALARMRLQFERNPTTTLAEFHVRCGATTTTNTPNLERLTDGLGWLAEWDGRQKLAARSADIFALAGTDDPILPRRMGEMAFSSLPSGHFESVVAHNHLLPITHPKRCAHWIEKIAS